MAINFGLSKKGFIAPTYQENLDSIEDDFRSKFGNDIVLTSNSNFGILAREIAWRETLMIQELQRTHYSGFISTATDSALDRLGANIGITRKVAMPATADIEITTDGEYLIQAGEQFETEDGIVFNLLDDVLTTQQTDGTWKGVGTVEADETGSMTNVEAGKINTISNPDDNILTVTNPEKAGGGQDDEDDETYQRRLVMNNIAKPGPTRNGIRSALINLNGVRQVGMVENSDGEVDAYGNPPYSVHIYVLGGTEKDVAQTLADKIAVGVILTGSRKITVNDATGQPREVAFDFATDKPVFVEVDIRTNANWNESQAGDQIKNAIAQKINMLEMGETVYLTKLYPVIYAIPGVEEATVKIGLAKESLDTADIKLKQFEAPSCDVANIEVNVNGL